MYRYGLLLCVVAFSGCVSTPPPPPDFRLTNSRLGDPRLTFALADVAGCQPLGIVSSDQNHDGGARYRLTEDAAQSRIMDSATKMGGDIVLLSQSTVGWAGTYMAGTAYSCSA